MNYFPIRKNFRVLKNISKNSFLSQDFSLIFGENLGIHTIFEISKFLLNIRSANKRVLPFIRLYQQKIRL